MTASSRGGRVLRSAALASPNLCSRCATSSPRLTARLYSTATAAAPTPSSELPPSLADHPSAPYDIRSGLILTRAPLLTRKLHSFENAFFFYQKRLEERLNTAFIPAIYYKPDTAKRMEWDLKVKERQGTVAKDIGTYHGKSAKAWDDELKVGDEMSTQENMLKALLKDAEGRVSDDAEIIPLEDVQAVELPGGRVSEADQKVDVKSLNREMDRTLYLVVKQKDGSWGFPAAGVDAGENLHQTAQRALDQAAGVNMNTWIVGRVPVAHIVSQPKRDTKAGTIQQNGQKTFFLKGRIMAGQADLKDNALGYTDFKWLTKEELKEALSSTYFRGVRNMIADR